MSLLNLKSIPALVIASAVSLTPVTNAAESDRLLIVGDAVWCNWNQDGPVEMLPVASDEDTFTYTGWFYTGNEGFKFLTRASWECDQYMATSQGLVIDGDGQLVKNGDDNKFKVAQEANYTVTCNLKDLTISVSKAAFQDKPVFHNVLYLIGDATTAGWSLNNAIKLNGDASNPFIFSTTATLTADGSFKIATTRYGGYGQKFYFRDSSDSNLISEDSENDRQWSVDSDGVYNVTVNLDDKTISMVRLSDIPATPDRTQICWYEPADGSLTDALTFYFDAAQGDAGLKGYTGDIYMHSGVLTTDSNSDSDWKHSAQWCDNDARYRLSPTGQTDLYTFTITPSEFFNLRDDEHVTSFAFVMRNADGSMAGKDTGSRDIFVKYNKSGDLLSQTPLGKVTGFSTETSRLTVTTENGILELTPYNDNVIKVFNYINGQPSAERRSITVCAQPEGNFSVEETDDAIILKTAGTIVRVEKVDSRISFANAAGDVILREKDGLDNSSVPRRISFAAMNDGAFYGGGYNGKRIDHDGQTLVMNNTQTGGWDATWDAPHNICIPFIVSTSGYGILFDDHYRGATITPSSAGTEYQSGSPTPISYYYVGSSDSSMASVMENYTFLTGRQELPPYWALGYITSRYGYKTQQEATEVVRNVKNAGIPLDGIVFDLYWQGEGNNGMGNLDWYRPNFADHRKMMSDFEALGVKTVCITEPFFTSDGAASNYNELKEKGYLADDNVNGMNWLTDRPVGLIDASNPDAMDWMWQFYKSRTEEGVGGWWLDLGEPERHDDDSNHQGGSVNQVHNEFGDLWTSRVWRGYKEEFPDVRPFLMPRAGTAGMQRYSTFPWTGDIRRSYKGLEAQIPALLSASMSGIGYIGSDVSGFSVDNNSTDSWLYLRWVEMATFSPMMRTHSTYLPEPYHDCYSDILPSVRKYINLRYSYLPYTYTLAWENATKGMPLARPTNFHETAGTSSTPDNLKDQYLWGRDILVAPVVTSNTFRRSITFPQGDWVDLDDMTKVYAGGQTIDYDAPLEKLPCFGRVGSFITRYSQENYSSTSEIDNSSLTVTYLADTRSQAAATRAATTTDRSVLFDDDHTSTSTIENGNYLLTTFEGEATPTGHTVSVLHQGTYAGMPQVRHYTFVIPGYSKQIASVGNDDSEFNSCSTPEQFQAAPANAYYLDSDNTLHIKTDIPTSASSSRIQVSSLPYVSALSQTISDNLFSFEYSSVTGLYSYQLPAGATASITIMTAGGSEVATISSLVADGTVHQVKPSGLTYGLYISSLEMKTSSGEIARKAIKTIVR